MAYDKPKIDLVNKKYETLSKGLNKIYGDVAKNADLIKKRNKTRLKGQLDGIAKMQKRFEDATNANVIAATNLQDQIGGDSDEEKEKARNMFVGQVNGLYMGGLDDIERFMKGEIDENGSAIKNGKAPTRGATSAFVNKLIGNAINVTDGLIGLDSFSDEYNEGLKNLAGSNGKNKGSLVLGSQYDGIFNTVNGETAMTQGKNLSYKDLMLHGRLSSQKGVKVFLDKDQSGGVFEQADFNIPGSGTVKVNTDVINTGEILDLSQVGKDYKKADNKYFTKVKGWDEYFKSPIKAIQATKGSGQFLVPFKYTDAKGNVVDGKRVDVKKRQEYFTTGEGAKVVNQVIQETSSEDMNGMIQAIGGMKLYQKYTTGSAEEKSKIMEIVKLGIIENMSPLVTKGETSKLLPSTTTNKVSYDGTDFELDAVYNVVKDNQKYVQDAILPHRGGALPPANVLESKFKNHYIQTSKARNGKMGAGKIESIQDDGAGRYKVTIINSVNSNTGAVSREIISYDLNDDASGINKREHFERDINSGHFPDMSFETLESMVQQSNDNVATFESGGSSSSNTTRTPIAKMNNEEFKAYINGDTVPKVDDVVNDFLGQNPVTGGVGPQGTTGTTGTTGIQGSQGTTYNISMAGNTSGTNVSFTQNPNGRNPISINVQGADDKATSTNIAKVLNWENDHDYSNFGFTGAIDLDKLDIAGEIKKNNPSVKGAELKALQAEEAVNAYIIGGVKGTAKGEKYWKETGKTSIVDNLDAGNGNFDRAKFDAMPGEVKHYLIDYKVNATGRSAKDFMLLANSTPGWTGEDSRKYPPFDVSNAEDVKKKKIYDDFDMANIDASTITTRDLEIARRSLYLDGGKKPGGGDPGAPWDLSDDRSVANRMDISGIKIDRFPEIEASDDDMSAKSKQITFFINNKLLPGDYFKDNNGTMVKVFNY